MRCSPASNRFSNPGSAPGKEERQRDDGRAPAFIEIILMTSVVSFDSFVGNRRVLEILRRAIDRERLPHALIFAGPQGVGKKTLALLLAQNLNCLHPRDGMACGSCGSCRKIRVGTHPDVRMIEPDGAFIKIDQVRALIEEIAFQPFEGHYRFAILNGADQMRQEGANCLLKTLEEPASQSFLILVTAKPYSLLGTIRSRARLLQFGPIPENLIEEYLVQQAARTREDARLAAVLINGSLGTALALDVAENRELRRQALRFISLLLRGESFAQGSALAAGIAKDKESFPSWLEIAATLLQDVYYAQISPERMRQVDIAAELKDLARAASHQQVVAAIESFKDLRATLPLNLNRQIALEALLLQQS
jgi:DNA polymerase-3 subunit delta'